MVVVAGGKRFTRHERWALSESAFNDHTTVDRTCRSGTSTQTAYRQQHTQLSMLLLPNKPEHMQVPVPVLLLLWPLSSPQAPAAAVCRPAAASTTTLQSTACCEQLC